MRRDITLIVLFAAMIFLFLCNFMSMGIVGDTLSKVMFGLVGAAAYVLPVFVFGVYLYYVLNADRDPKTAARTAAVIGLFVIFMVFAHLLTGDLENMQGYAPASMWKTCSEERTGGGILGGTLAFVLYRLLKTFGAVLVLLVAAVGCIYVIGQRSFLELFRSKAMDARLAREERLEQRDEERRSRRREPAGETDENLRGSADGENGEDWDGGDDYRSHYEETRIRYQELHRQRMAREARERAAVSASAGMSGSGSSGMGNRENPDGELDAPSIRSGRMAGAVPESGKLHHFRGIVGNTALTEEEAYQPDTENNAAAVEPKDGFAMPADVLTRNLRGESGEKTTGDAADLSEEDDRSTAVSAAAEGTGMNPSAEIREEVGGADHTPEQDYPPEDNPLLDSDELHEILPEDFPDETVRDEEGASEKDEWIPATIIRGDAGSSGSDSSDSSYSYDFSESTDSYGSYDSSDSSDSYVSEDRRVSEKKPEKGSDSRASWGNDPDSPDPYADMPEIREVAAEENSEESSAAEEADSSDSIAIHTEREEGSSAVNQALNDNPVYDAGSSSSGLNGGGAGAASAVRNSSSPERGANAASPSHGKREYIFPPISLLHPGKKSSADSETELRHTAQTLQTTLENFGVRVTITDISQGPAVTRYEMLPEMGVKVSRIVSLADDIKLALAATDIRIEAPIPGKSAIGIEVPNREAQPVALRDIIDTAEFRGQKSKIAFAVGKDIAGKPVYGDIAKMPHVLIAGATGSGKSVCINTIIMSILYHAKPDEVKLIMIDPKVVELSVYNGIPHLLIPVVTNPQKAAAALNWGVAEMEARYRHFADAKVRDIRAYNQKAKEAEKSGDNPEGLHFMPQIVIIVDELADLMMVAKNDVETAICRLAQLARAAGIYLIIATQRPSVDVITGLIKANMPSRIAFRVTSGVDSRTILDMNGAEKLLGKGDMLFFPQGLPKPTRVQGCFVSDEEVNDVVQFVIDNNPITDEDSKKHQAEIDAIESGAEGISGGVGPSGAAADAGPDQDELFGAAGAFIIEKNNASIGLLQRRYRIGFNRAARIMDQLCDAGVVSDSEGTKSRNILMTMEQFLAYCHDNGIGVPDSV